MSLQICQFRPLLPLPNMSSVPVTTAAPCRLCFAVAHSVLEQRNGVAAQAREAAPSGSCCHASYACMRASGRRSCGEGTSTTLTSAAGTTVTSTSSSPWAWPQGRRAQAPRRRCSPWSPWTSSQAAGSCAATTATVALPAPAPRAKASSWPPGVRRRCRPKPAGTAVAGGGWCAPRRPGTERERPLCPGVLVKGRWCEGRPHHVKDVVEMLGRGCGMSSR